MFPATTRRSGIAPVKLPLSKRCAHVVVTGLRKTLYLHLEEGGGHLDEEANLLVQRCPFPGLALLVLVVTLPTAPPRVSL